VSINTLVSEITFAPIHFHRGRMGLKFTIAAGDKTPSLGNLLQRNLACRICVKMMSTDTLGLIDTFVQ
jgi:hypothetical protein